METHIPEGLQHQSVSTIASFIANSGFNCVRLTYSIDMALDTSQKVSDSFAAAAGLAGVSSSDMEALYQEAVSKNSFIASATTLGVFGTVIDALSSKGVYTILDNQVSKASWCCSGTDGNGWWDAASGYNADYSRYFNTQNWLKGLSAMASFSNSHTGVVGMSIRNELRAASNQDQNNHADWYKYVGQGAEAIHSANSNLLIMIGGISYDTDLSFIYNKNLDTFTSIPNRIVWEIHAYSWSGYGSTCSDIESSLGNKAGYLIAEGKSYTAPLWMSEFGVGWSGGNVDGGLTSSDDSFLKCIVSYMSGNDADWALWALQGDYYVRQGQVSFEETFGILKKDWSGLRNSETLTLLGNMLKVSQGP
ncbi:MAG: hypothetical protein Q9157_003141 [Trypethelium eluteriae]